MRVTYCRAANNKYLSYSTCIIALSYPSVYVGAVNARFTLRCRLSVVGVDVVRVVCVSPCNCILVLLELHLYFT